MVTNMFKLATRFRSGQGGLMMLPDSTPASAGCGIAPEAGTKGTHRIVCNFMALQLSRYCVCCPDVYTRHAGAESAGGLHMHIWKTL